MDSSLHELESRLPFVLNGYIFEEVLGKGSFSTVFKVQHMASKQYFATKALERKFRDGEIHQPDVRGREIEVLKRLYHPHIVKIYDVFEVKAILFIIIQYCSGGSLKSLIKSNKIISMKQKISIMKQCLEALEYCHSNKVSHGDIKPDNILLDMNGVCYLGDFGFSRSNDDDNGKINNFSGSLPYKAPELIKKVEFDPMKADIWGMGVTFFYLLTGRLPWPVRNEERIEDTISVGVFAIPPDVPPPLQKVIKMMMTVEPSSRFSPSVLMREPIFFSVPTVPIQQEDDKKSKLPLLSIRPGINTTYHRKKYYSRRMSNHDVSKAMGLTPIKNYHLNSQKKISSAIKLSPSCSSTSSIYQ